MKLNPVAKEILEWVYCVIIAVALALTVRYFIGTPTVVQMPSMYPTLKPNDRLVLNKLSRTFGSNYERGDIVTFEAPSIANVSSTKANLENPIAEYTNEPDNIFGKFVYYVLEIGKDSYIKRVIGLPGEHVKIENNKVYINGKELDEPYLNEGVVTTARGTYVDIVVPEGTLFLMGDNRSNSTDSRAFGCVPIERIESKVWIRFWPLNLFGKVE